MPTRLRIMPDARGLAIVSQAEVYNWNLQPASCSSHAYMMKTRDTSITDWTYENVSARFTSLQFSVAPTSLVFGIGCVTIPSRAVTVFQFLVVAPTFSTLSKKLFDSFVLPCPFGRKRKISRFSTANNSPSALTSSIICCGILSGFVDRKVTCTLLGSCFLNGFLSINFASSPDVLTKTFTS